MIVQTQRLQTFAVQAKQRRGTETQALALQDSVLLGLM